MIEMVNGHDIPPETPGGRGLFEGFDEDGHRHLTSVRKIAGEKDKAKRSPGTLPIWAATWLIAAVGGVAMFVSFSAQRQYIFNVRHSSAMSIAEALLPDLMLAVVTLLALGLSLAGKSSRTERVLILAAAATSGFMNLSDGGFLPGFAKPFTFLLASVVFAVAVDRVVSVIRRHRLGESETSPWTTLGGAVVSITRISALILLYGLRTVLAPKETVKGLRRGVLLAAPVPGKVIEVESEVVPQLEQPSEDEHQDDDPTASMYLRASDRCAAEVSPGAVCMNLVPCPDHSPAPELPAFRTKKAALLSLYRGHPNYGDRATASKTAEELAPLAGLQPGTGRTYIGEELTRLAQTVKSLAGELTSKEA